MKRVLGVALIGLMFIGAMSAQETVATLQTKLEALEANVPPMVERLNVLDKKKDDIQFVAAAYSKQDAKYTADVTDFNAKRADINRQQALLNPAEASQAQRSAQHNAQQCTAPQGSNACAWYNNEAAALNAEMATNQRIQSGIDAQQSALDQQKGWLDQTKDKLETIFNGLQSDNAAWVAAMAQLKADYESNRNNIIEVQRQIGLATGNKDACIKAIPPACSVPAYGPDGKPTLDENCERMHAICGKLFDGN